MNEKHPLAESGESSEREEKKVVFYHMGDFAIVLP
jgi:hypothetical protein